jgi:antirestriction protein ArdC
LDIYQSVTQSIIDAIESNPGNFTLPWHRGVVTLPKNAQSKKLYQGVNIVSLWCMGMAKGYSTATWATYKQWQELGCQVRKGERSSTIIYYSTTQKEQDDGTEKTVAFIKASGVFNADQVDGYTPEDIPVFSPIERLEAVETFVKGTGATIHYGGPHACYVQELDLIRMPEDTRFFDTDGKTQNYYSTLMHELVHWTGHPTRKPRDMSGKFGSHQYAIEELVAELGAAFLCARLGISNEPRADHAGYLQSWLGALHNDKRFIFSASAQAQLAVDYLLQLSPPLAT